MNEQEYYDIKEKYNSLVIKYNNLIQIGDDIVMTVNHSDVCLKYLEQKKGFCICGLDELTRRWEKAVNE